MLAVGVDSKRNVAYHSHQPGLLISFEPNKRLWNLDNIDV
jgi:hypothetical protein